VSRTRANGVLRDWTPPALLRAASKAKVRATSSRVPESGTVLANEVGPEWYDESFESHDHWRRPYTKSPWYYIWTVLTDRIIAGGPPPKILDIGCGSGQMAEMLFDHGVQEYVGLDFSPKRIEWAKKTVPGFRFEVADAYSTDLFQRAEYDTVVCTEFLEHVDGDLTVIDRIPPGKRFLGTVPDFGGGSHVRFFASAAAVEERYSSHFGTCSVTTWTMAGQMQGRQFLIDAVTTGP
jgi:SAM-dependent methyltransferase